MSRESENKENSQALGEQAWKAFIKQNVKAKINQNLKGDTIIASELMCRILNRSLAHTDVAVKVSSRLANDIVYLSPSLFKIFERFYKAHQMNLDRLRKTD
jgi:hypothetical protein